MCVLSIRDNVRKEAADAIREVQGAGVQVVMVTGDRRETAVAIATEAGLLKDPEDLARKILRYYRDRPRQRLRGETDIDSLVGGFLSAVDGLEVES